MSTEIDELLPEFLAECQEIFERIQSELDQIGNGASNEDTEALLDGIYRGIHTVKGGASMFQLQGVVEKAGRLEADLGRIKSERRALTPAEIAHIREECEGLGRLLASGNGAGAPAPEPAPAPEAQAPVASKSASVPASPVVAVAPHPQDFVRIPVKRVNEVNNLVSEVFLVRNQLLYLVERLKSSRIDTKEFIYEWEVLDSVMRRGLRDLGSTAMGMRMTKVKNLFDRMDRAVETYVGQTGKRIELETLGEGTELDKKVLDALGEPLIHLIRNAMDHGIEMPADRIRAGKREKGRICLEALSEGNQVILRISDDGRGISAQKVLASAKAKGLDVSHVTTDKAAIALILLPGFSTADQVTEISGRGVGMDAVKTCVVGLGGQLDIDTAVGKGTTFTITLPLSMSMSSVLLVNVNGIIYGIPTYEVIETRRIPTKELKHNHDKLYVEYEGHFVPCLDLARHFDAKAHGFEANAREAFILFYQCNGLVRAVRVHGLMKNNELVVKPVASVFPSIPYIVGHSVLPTGEPIFIASLRRMEDGMKEGVGLAA